MSDHAIYMAPWRELQASGALGPEYGPSPSTFARRLAAYKTWSWRPEYAARADLPRLAAVIERGGASKREQEAFELVYLQRLPERKAADMMGCTRDTVRTYLKRLRAKART